MFRVAVARCADYQPATVEAALDSLLSGLGWLDTGLHGRQAFVKPNLLMPRRPDECVTTHPAIIAALARRLAVAGCSVTIGDSPGGSFTRPVLERLYDQTGMTAVAAETGAALSFDTRGVEQEGRGLSSPRRFLVCEAMVSADLLVSVCKLKTHGLTGLTAAVKNLFGCIPGLHKTEFHMNQPTVESFSGMLVDLARHMQPALTICDAVVAMEGAGPSHGRPRPMGLLMAATDPFALDYALARLLGVDAAGFTTVAAAAARGYGPRSASELEVALSGSDGPQLLAGEAAVQALASLRPASFELLEPENLTGMQGRGLVRQVLRHLQPQLRSRPEFQAGLCNRCGTCVRNCPARALTMRSVVPEVDVQACIRCYCCQELCPLGAVRIARPWLSRVLYRRR